jgi:DNA-binding ferritin-like protein (Dps family)
MRTVSNVYEEIGIENPEDMLEKAGIVAGIIDAMETLKITTPLGAEMTGTDIKHFTDIIRGQFHSTSREELQKILSIVRTGLI